MIRDYIVYKILPFRLVKELRRIWLYSKALAGPKELNDILLENLYVEKILKDYIKDRMNCVDIGSHLGNILEIILEKSPHGNHIAVEPVDYKFKWLKKRYPKINVLNLALDNFSGIKKFYQNRDASSFSGLYNVNPVSNSDTIEVQCEKLDNIVPSDINIGLIKIVIEGGELIALKSGQNLIEQCHPAILFECAQSNIELYGIETRDVFEFLVNEFNYSIYTPKGWLMRNKPLSLHQFIDATQYPYKAFRFFAVPCE